MRTKRYSLLDYFSIPFCWMVMMQWSIIIDWCKSISQKCCIKRTLIVIFQGIISGADGCTDTADNQQDGSGFSSLFLALAIFWKLVRRDSSLSKRAMPAPLLPVPFGPHTAKLSPFISKVRLRMPRNSWMMSCLIRIIIILPHQTMLCEAISPKPYY